jgi:hypothetical protein
MKVNDSLTPRPLYARYPLGRRLSGPQSLSGRGGIEKISLSLLGIEPPRKIKKIGIKSNAREILLNAQGFMFIVYFSSPGK